MVDVVERNTNDEILHVVITMKTWGNQSWVLSSAYVPTVAEECQHGWNENCLVSTMEEGHAVDEDFNCLLMPEDNQGGSSAC